MRVQQTSDNGAHKRRCKFQRLVYCNSNSVPFPNKNINLVLFNLSENKSMLNRSMYYFHSKESGIFYHTSSQIVFVVFLFLNSNVREKGVPGAFFLKKQE